MFKLSWIAVAGLVMMANTSVAQDAAKGEKLFKKCKACHMIGPEARNRTGPNLTGALGRVAGTYDDFDYSKSMTALGETGMVWTEELIFDYLLNPKKFLRKALDNKRAKANMSFRLKGEQDRRDVIAYLATFGAPGDESAMVETAGNICVVNGAQEAHLFAVEAHNGEATGKRITETLEPGQTLCVASIDGAGGVVSVFESAEELEGCSRLVEASKPETLDIYADFDRCAWASNS